MLLFFLGGKDMLPAIQQPASDGRAARYNEANIRVHPTHYLSTYFQIDTQFGG